MFSFRAAVEPEDPQPDDGLLDRDSHPGKAESPSTEIPPRSTWVLKKHEKGSVLLRLLRRDEAK